MSTWIRRRLSYCESFAQSLVLPYEFEPCAYDDTTVTLRGYRARREETLLVKETSDYENGCEMSVVAMLQRSSISPDTSSIGDISNGSTLRDTTPCADYDRDTTPAPVTYTPVLRRKHSRASHLRRNYRIIAPDESLLILQQHSAPTDQQKKNKLLRRKSTKKENEILPRPMVITPPVLLNRTQSCNMCSREIISQPSPDEPMSPTAITSPNRLSSEEEAARLSLISSSTGYSSARSSLRSSDGGDEGNNRDSGVGSCVLSLSSDRHKNGSTTSQLDRIAIELVDTERTYVNDLNDVIQGYLNFLVDRREELQVTLDDVSSLFGCIERIYLFNSRLYHQLDRAQLDCIKIASCFIDNVGKFEDYIAYCTNYHKMLGALTLLQQQAGVAAVLSERQQFLGHALPLSSYLLKPVQRILKYHLFIENMLKNLCTDTTPEDRAVVKQAYDVMTAQAGKINDEKKRVEHAERVTHLQSALHKWKVDKTNNLMAYGDLLLEAQFKQAGSKTLRTLFLFEEMLLIVKQRNGAYSCKDYILCSNLMLNESISEEEPLAFQVVSFDNPRNTYIFLANSMDQKRTWMTELKRMMLDHYAVEIPEKTKQLMLSMDNTQKIVFGRPEFAEVNLKNNKKVPKYLEKRRKSVDQENRRRSLSASRLLATSKSSITSAGSIQSPGPKYKLFGVEDEQPKCSCHLVPGPSEEKTPVSRTLSASTIDFGALTLPPSKPIIDVQSSRTRFHQARNRRHLPPKHEKSLPPRTENVEAHFDALYNQLVSVGADEDKSRTSMIWRVDTVVPSARSNRSKSLTRLDDQIFDEFQSTHYTKLEQAKRSGKRNTCDESRIICPDIPTGFRGLHDDRHRPLSARQRAPLSVEQAAELDMLLPSVGVVKSRIRQIELNK